VQTTAAAAAQGIEMRPEDSGGNYTTRNSTVLRKKMTAWEKKKIKARDEEPENILRLDCYIGRRIQERNGLKAGENIEQVD